MSVMSWNFVQKALDWAVKLTVILGLAIAGYLYSGYQDFVECQARYNDRMNERTEIIGLTTAAEREAEAAHDKVQNALLTDPAALKPREERTPEEAERIRQKTIAWVEASRQQDQKRQQAAQARLENPIPPPPSELCG